MVSEIVIGLDAAGRICLSDAALRRSYAQRCGRAKPWSAAHATCITLHGAVHHVSCISIRCCLMRFIIITGALTFYDLRLFNWRMVFTSAEHPTNLQATRHRLDTVT